MAQPVAGIPDMGLLVLQAEGVVADLAQERGAVDLGLQAFGLQLLHAAAIARSPARCSRTVSASKRPSRASWDTSPAELPAAGSKWYLRSR
jgi:hypothetical protein